MKKILFGSVVLSLLTIGGIGCGGGEGVVNMDTSMTPTPLNATGNWYLQTTSSNCVDMTRSFFVPEFSIVQTEDSITMRSPESSEVIMGTINTDGSVAYTTVGVPCTGQFYQAGGRFGRGNATFQCRAGSTTCTSSYSRN